MTFYSVFTCSTFSSSDSDHNKANSRVNVGLVQDAGPKRATPTQWWAVGAREAFSAGLNPIRNTAQTKYYFLCLLDVISGKFVHVGWQQISSFVLWLCVEVEDLHLTAPSQLLLIFCVCDILTLHISLLQTHHSPSLGHTVLCSTDSVNTGKFRTLSVVYK